MANLWFLGDVFLPRPFSLYLDLEGEIVLNLEGPITTAESVLPGKPVLRMPADYTQETIGRKPLAVCLANNHIADFSQRGIRDTLESLQDAGVRTFGVGSLAEDCNNPLILSLDGTIVGLLAFTELVPEVLAQNGRLGALPPSVPVVERLVRQSRALGADRVVVCVHWGVEDVFLPRPVGLAGGGLSWMRERTW